MDPVHLGTSIRAIRIRRGWRQVDLAGASGVSRGTISRIERGHLGGVSVQTLIAVSRALDAWLDLVLRWRGGELDRLVNAGHSAMHEQMARRFRDLPGWTYLPEVSFSYYGERGVVDALAWHAPSRTLVVVELKTLLVDVQELIGNVDRKRRLAPAIVEARGWRPNRVVAWVVVAESRSNRRRLEAHRALLRAAFPTDGRSIRDGRSGAPPASDSLWFLPDAHHGGTKRGSGGRQRVRRSAPPAHVRDRDRADATLTSPTPGDRR
jgi:transcriptional regulator with XRE-family HTH domain